MHNIKNIKRPKLIYKYSRITEYSLDSLSKGCYWFSNNDKLNDPFDCQFSYADSLFEKMGIAKQDQNYFDNIFKKLWGWGICCFTEDNSNFLMWSHYADAHKGFCLEFETVKCQQLSKHLLPVFYSDQYPIIKEFDEIIPNGVLRKTKKWEYEKEWRLIIGMSGDCYFPYNKQALKSIFFGVKTSNDKIREIVSLSNKSDYHNLKYFKAIQSNDNYVISFQEFNIN